MTARMKAAQAGLRRARAWLRNLGPRSVLIVLALLGAISALAHAPYHVSIALAVGLSALLLALDDARSKPNPVLAAFFRAWAFGFGHFLAGTFWVANAFLVSAQDHAWLIWAPLTLLPGGLALFWGAAGMAYTALRPRADARVLAFAGLFFTVEALRSHILSGFPWNLAGHVFEAGGAISQTASLVGALGLTAITLYVFSAPAALLGRGSLLNRAHPVFLSALLVVGLWTWGSLRLANAHVEETDARVRVVQLNRAQSELRPEAKDEILEEYLLLTAQPGIEEADLVIWPEGSIPAYLLNEPVLLERIRTSLPVGTRLAAGAPHVEWGPEDTPRAYFNSLHFLKVQTESLLVEGRYDKARLVPFGEANTLAALTRPFGLETLSQYGIGFDPGSGAEMIHLEHVPPFAPLICYEVIYPEYAFEASSESQWILNASNDSWFGHSAGPAQLLNQAGFRSIEQGLPLVRAATAGMSGLIDPYGRVVHIANVEESQVLDLVLLASMDKPLYARFGHVPALIICLIFIGLAHLLPRAARGLARR